MEIQQMIDEINVNLAEEMEKLEHQKAVVEEIGNRYSEQSAILRVIRILKPDEIIDRLKYAEKQCVKGYYYILIRPDARDRIIELMKKQEAEIRQLRLALDIAKGTCKGIKVEGR